MKNRDIELLRLMARHPDMKRSTLVRYAYMSYPRFFSGKTPKALGQSLKALEKDGLIRSYELEQPARRGPNPMAYSVTPAGHKAVREYLAEHEKALGAVK